MHLVHVVRDLELASGGPSRSIPQLVLALDRFSCDENWRQSVVFQDRGKPNAEFPGGSQALNVVPVSVKGKPLLALRSSIEELNREHPISLIHVHGLWNLPAHQVIKWARGQAVPYVVSPRGMLSQWCFNHKRWKKEIGWHLYQKRDLARAAGIHATSPEELSDVRRMRLANQVAVVPNGSELPNYERKLEPKVLRTALCLTRLHPVKGIDILIEAWSRLMPQNWRLIIAGPSEDGMREKLASLIQQRQLSSIVELREETNGLEKEQLFRQADLFVLPSKSENFGMVIAEALALGLPVITTIGTPWSGIRDYECGWYVEPDLSSISTALAEATALTDDRLHSMGAMGRRLIADRYAWSAVADRMKSFYLSLLLP